MTRRPLRPHLYAVMAIMFLSAWALGADAPEAPTTGPAITIDILGQDEESPESSTTVPVLTFDILTPDEEALGRGVDALLAAMSLDEEESGLLFPLIKQRKVVGTEDVEYRYTKKMVPIYKHIRKPVEELVPVRQGYTVVMKRVVRMKVVKRIKIGEKEQLVQDPNGKIVKTVKRKVYGPGGPDIQPVGWLGNNAMALYALLEAGASPDEHPQMEQMAKTLDACIINFGVPDYTWDIAWAVAALSRYPEDRFDKAIEKLLGRLISGQCTARRAKGMWGPVCVNLDHLAKVIVEFAKTDLYAEKVAGLARQFSAPNDPRVLKAKDDLDTARRIVTHLFRNVSNSGHRFSLATKPGVIESDMAFPYPELEAAGWPYNLFYETMADLQSTALAAMALRVAHDHGKLPEAFSFKHLTGLKKESLARPVQTKKALAQTLATLSAAQNPATGWDEMIVWEKTTEFARIAETFKGPPVDVPRSVESRRMPICNAQAVGAMEDLLVILGKADQLKYGSRVAAASLSVGADPNATFALPPAVSGKEKYTLKYYSLFDPNTGGVIEPYDLICQLRLDPAKLEDDPERLAVFAKMTEFLLANQGKDGLWPCRDNILGAWTPAMREFYLHRVPQRVKEAIERWKTLGVEPKREYTQYNGLSSLAPSRYWIWVRTTDHAKWRATTFAVLTLGRTNRNVVSSQAE